MMVGSDDTTEIWQLTNFTYKLTTARKSDVNKKAFTFSKRNPKLALFTSSVTTIDCNFDLRRVIDFY